MEKEIQKKCPYKIDIGAIFTHKVKLYQCLQDMGKEVVNLYPYKINICVVITLQVYILMVRYCYDILSSMYE